jgi:ribonuclease PH
MRIDNRTPDQMRPIEFLTDYTLHAEGSVLVSFGKTRVLCTASVENSLPKWMQGGGKGWVTAEYAMLPRATHTRSRRDKAMNSGRSVEISRLIGRSLRAVVDMEKLGERQITVDCDVIQADGGTRTAAITGGFVAMAIACGKLLEEKQISEIPLKDYLGAVSVGLGTEGPLLDLCYEEDCGIDTDMNFVMTGNGNFVEIQGTAEGAPFSREQMNVMTDFAAKGCDEIFSAQEKVIGAILKR